MYIFYAVHPCWSAHREEPILAEIISLHGTITILELNNVKEA